ncbi:hypothetical protein K2173_017761 [Erythroxylum novogranatense]|uniref:Uncharacterized protein n=1 Tax=Erythroxylum novogranatense TaxID=1862640 RepID=A0AAV8SMF4_9ROSI|nr:hypothetical protein K2173_017761 [Erythroxylum novogranatense]
MDQSLEDSSSKEEISRVLEVLEALKQASHELQTHASPIRGESNSPAIKALLELETESDAILSKDPHLSTLSRHLANLKSLVDTLEKSHGLRSFLTRRVSTHSISRVANSIESEIQAWIDRESVEKLSKALKFSSENEEELVGLLEQLEKRLSEGFDRELQGLVLKSKMFSNLERILCDSSCSQRLREQCAFVIAALIKFNKDVFAGQVLMGPMVHALLSMASWKSLKVLCSLIKSIKSPLVDEIESNGEIPKIISFLDYKDLQMRVLAMDVILEIGYFGRKEAIDAMIKEGLIKKLVELQRSELGGDLIDIGRFDEKENNNNNRENEGKKENRESRQKRFLESHPFASCVARFAVQLEVGEGLRQRERRAFKQEILERVKEVSASDAEAATIVAEVLWGSSP